MRTLKSMGGENVYLRSSRNEEDGDGNSERWRKRKGIIGVSQSVTRERSKRRGSVSKSTSNRENLVNF